MIQFKYGVREQASKVAAAASASAAKIFESVFDLPENLRPKPISQVEQDAIRYGGGADYELPAKRGAAKKK